MLVATPSTAATSSHAPQSLPSVSTLVTTTPDFDLTANPTSLTMSAGATQSSVITATSLNGFAGTVYLTPFSYPFVVSLSSTSLTLSARGTASSTATVSAPSTTPPGNHTIEIDATGGCSLLHYTLISAEVTGPDFAISALKTQLTIAQGGSDTSTVNLASKNGFTSTVTLTSLTFNPYFLASLLPTSVSLNSGGTGTSVLTVQASSALEPGNYTFSVSGSSGALHHSVYFDVTVTGPTFGMSAYREFLTLLAGGATNSSTITVSPAGAFSGPVSLTAGPSSFPPGLTVSLDKGSVTLPPTGTATLTLGAPPGTKTGSYFVDVTGTSGAITKYASVFVTVNGPDFDISPDPFLLTVVAGGGSCTSLISVTPVHGFTGSVGLTWKAKSGLTASLDKSSVIVPGTATLTVSAALSTVPGFYGVEINGTTISPAITHTTSVIVIVIGPDFSLSANPPALTVTAGGSASMSTIGMNAENGFSSSVALKASSFETKLTPSLSAPSISGTGTSILSVTAATDAVPGDFYSVEVNGTSGALTHSIYIPVTVIGPDFTISSTPASITFGAGTSTTSTITISPTLEFAAQVDLNAFSSSIDLNASIAPTTVTSGSYTATLSVNSTIPGVYTIDLFASSGGIFHDLTIPVIVEGPDFTLSANPSTLIITAGSFQTSTISLNPLNGFTGSVRLTPYPPVDTFTSISPTSITPGATSTLTVNVDATASQESYTVEVQGTSGPLAHSVFITVKVPSFTLTSNPDALTIAHGATQSSTITVASQNGFGDAVQLTASAPTGLTAVLAPTSITGSGLSQLSITASSDISPGTYEVNVTGTSGQRSQKATVMVTIPSPDFDIAPSTPITVPCSTSANCNTTITITAQNGFGGLVAFTVSAVSTPPGLSCPNAPSAVAGSGNTFLTCSAASPGDYSVIVTGTSQGLQHATAAITYHVVVGQDFSISAGTVSPAAILTGSLGSSVITVGPVGGFTGPIIFIVSASSPTGLNCQPIADWSGSGTSTLTCTSSVAGDYTVTVTGTTTINSSPVHRATSSIVFHVVGFTIAASPTAVTVNTNAGGTSAITITAINQFNGVVNLSADNGACSITPSTVTGSGPATLSCTFTSAGTTTVTITGSSGSLSPTAAVTFTVYAVTTPDFTISATTPASFTSGGTSTSTVTVTAQNTFYSRVDLTFSVSPSTGLSVSLNPQSFLYGSGTSTATFSSSTPGTYTVTVTGTSGSLTNTAQVTVTVTAEAQPTAPAPTILGLDPTLFYVLVGGIIALLVIGSVTVVVRRKKP